MLFHSVGLLAVAAQLIVAQDIDALPAKLQRRDGPRPGMRHDPNTAANCEFWMDNDGSITCDIVPDMWGISMSEFLSWNPSITPNCENYVTGRSYCVRVTNKPESTSTLPPIGFTTSTVTKTTSTITSSTQSANGVKTPSPIQPDLVGNCNKFYWVNRGESCDIIAATNGIALEQFLSWNPKAGQTCSGLWADTYACVSVIGYEPPKTSIKPSTTSTKPSNGVQTPLPTQPGMVGNCNKFAYVSSGESCPDITSKAGISASDFSTWNPRVGDRCTGLWANAYACVGVLPAFRLKTRYHADCTGDVHNDVSVSSGVCINTDCRVASVDIAAEGYCPDGQVQISYWEQPGCGGKWFGYGYTNRGQCRTLWTEGWKFKAIHLNCASKQTDCVTQGTCKYDAEPSSNTC